MARGRTIGGSASGGLDFDELTVDIAFSAGLSPRQVDELTMPEINAYYKLWQRWPPVHKLVAWGLGYKPKADETKPLSRDEFARLVAATGGRL